MPFKSEKQRKYLWKFKPSIARRWAEEGKAYVSKSYKHHKYKKGDKR